MNTAFANEITELNEVVVFGVGLTDLGTLDQTEWKCQVGDTNGCSVTHTKDK